MPRTELQNILKMGAKGDSTLGLQVVNTDWINDCINRDQLIDDNSYLIQL